MTNDELATKSPVLFGVAQDRLCRFADDAGEPFLITLPLMSKSRKTKRHINPPASLAPRRRLPLTAIAALAVAVAAVGGYWWFKGRQSDAQPATAPVTVDTTNPTASSATLNPAFEKLKGRWLRPDGGYVVDIRGVEPSGKMDAAYFNPGPIHVAKAEASQEGGVTKLFVELRDVNYPGSTYTLAYEAASDRLTGIYYQAALQQRFEVVFVRMK
jgi:hypothetical protein